MKRKPLEVDDVIVWDFGDPDNYDRPGKMFIINGTRRCSRCSNGFFDLRPCSRTRYGIHPLQPVVYYQKDITYCDHVFRKATPAELSLLNDETDET